MVSLKYDLVGDAWLGWLYHLAGCVVGAGQGLVHGLFRASPDMKHHQRASTRAASQKHTPGVLSKLYFVAVCVVGISQGIWLGLFQPNHLQNQSGSNRARPKTTKRGDTREAPRVNAFSRTKQRLFAWFNSGRGSGSAARSGSAAAASSRTLLSHLYSSCSRLAAELAARVSCKTTGAGGSAPSAAYAAKPNLVSGDGAGKSVKGSRSSSQSVPHSFKQDDRTSGSPDKLLIHQAQELMHLGIQALDQANLAHALDLFNNGLKLNTADNKLNARLHHNKGCALVGLNRYALGIMECCKAIDLDKDMWQPYIVRHLAWRHVGLYTKAAEDLVVAQAKGGPSTQLFIHDFAKADSLQYGSLLGLGNNGKPLQKRDVKIAYRGLMRECHPDKAPDDERHEHQRHVAHMLQHQLAQHLNFAQDKLQAFL